MSVLSARNPDIEHLVLIMFRGEINYGLDNPATFTITRTLDDIVEHCQSKVCVQIAQLRVW